MFKVEGCCVCVLVWGFDFGVDFELFVEGGVEYFVGVDVV